MNFFSENWLAITTFVFGSGGLGTLIGWLLRDRKIQSQEIKKGDVDVKKQELDYAMETREYFLARENDFKSEKEELKAEVKIIKDDSKSERDYYRKKIDEIRSVCDGLQTKFDSISLNYALEVEKSEKWMQKYFEMEKENKQLKQDVVNLENKCESLETKHNELQQEFELYKKSHK